MCRRFHTGTYNAGGVRDHINVNFLQLEANEDTPWRAGCCHCRLFGPELSRSRETKEYCHIVACTEDKQLIVYQLVENGLRESSTRFVNGLPSISREPETLPKGTTKKIDLYRDHSRRREHSHRRQVWRCVLIPTTSKDRAGGDHNNEN